MYEFVIIADDFTGANDTGVQIRKKGIPVQVILDTEHMLDDGMSVVIDTESRVVSPQEAYHKVFAAVQKVLHTGGCRFLYKKVDSTLRGHIQEEIRAAIDAYKPETIIFAPSYPSQMRIVKNNRLYVHGTVLLETEIAKDPRNPLREDNITNILTDTIKQPVTHYTVEQIETNKCSIEKGAYTFDAVTDEHLQYIAEKVLQSQRKVLWIGSAGLAAGILQKNYDAKPALAVVGSISQKTMEQIAYCKSQGVQVVKIDMIEAYQTKNTQKTIDKCIELLQNNISVIVTAAACRGDYEEFAAYGKRYGMTTDELAEFVKRTLSHSACEVLKHVTSINKVFLTGGDTAIAVIQQLHAKGEKIEKEIVPGFVQGTLCGGFCNGMTVITKAGAFGTEKDMYFCIKK